jgi:hypothetical protein
MPEPQGIVYHQKNISGWIDISPDISVMHSYRGEHPQPGNLCFYTVRGPEGNRQATIVLTSASHRCRSAAVLVTTTENILR